jgi:outer membrane protein OmpA-like peptidoglycan-associated protein
MKNFTHKLSVFALITAALAVMLSSCGARRTQRGAAIGAGAGATVGALIGKTAGNTALGTIIGGAIGGTAGAYIGHKMDQVSGYNPQVSFYAGSSELDTAARTSLKRLVNYMQGNPKFNILVVGHTDSLGAADYNMDLSIKRADAVKSFLVSNGINGDRITTQGKGSTQNIASNTTREGRAKNRRAEVIDSDDKTKHTDTNASQ